jgi:predicted nuclease with TOPRIM domain
MTLPNNLALVGIGGAGKELVLKVLEQDWIIDYYLKPIEGGNRSLRAYIIDTATVEYDGDMKRHDRIMKRVKEMERVYHGAGGTVSLNVVCLTNVIAVNRPSDLTKKEVRAAIRKDTQVWWLEDPERGLGGQFKKLKQLDSGIDQDFKQGTYRRRAMSKAVFCKAFSSGKDPLNFNVTGSEVAIVTGLGGGTGSGMFFDVARELGEGRGGANNITLFAVLPTTNERDIEKTNAYVALSELEYANLNDMPPFDHTILLPFEPTGFRGTIGSKEVEEFDDVFPYILTSSYALTENMRVGDVIEKYTGFILADGCIIRYGMEELLEIKRRIESTIEELNKSVREEEIFRNTLFNRLSNMKRLVGTRDIAVVPDFALYLSSRLNSVEIWNDHAFEILGFDTVRKVKDGIASWKKNGGRVPDDNDFKGLVEYIEDLELILQGINSRDIDPISPADQNLLPDLIRVLTTIRTTGDQIKILSSMDINVPALSKVVTGNVPSPADERALRDSINSEKNEIERLEQSRREKKSELEGLETRREEVEGDAERICTTLKPKLDTLWTMRKRFNESRDNIDSLDTKVTDFVNKAFAEDVEIGVHGPGSFRDSLGFKDIVKRINDLSDILHGANDFDIKNFLNDVAAYNYHKKRHTDLQDGKRGRIKSLIYGGGKRDKRKIDDAEIARDRAFQSIKADDDRWDIHVTEDNVDISVAHIISDMMGQKINEAIGEIVDYISSRRVGDETKNDIKHILMADYLTSLDMVDDANKYLKNKFLEKENYEERKRSLEAAIVDMKDEIEKSGNRTGLLTDVKELVDETRRTINRTCGLWDTYRKKMEEVGKIDTMVGKIVSEEEATYISKTEPDLAVLAGVKEDSSLGSLFGDIPVALRAREIDRIMGGVTRLVTTNLLSRKYLGVEKVAIEYDPERWNFRMGVLFASTLCEGIQNRIANSELELIGVVSKELSLSDPEDAHIEPYNVAGRWDVGLALFALPVFFDNLRSVDGYKSAFDRRKRRKDVVNILHHALLLEEGKIVYRKDKLEPVEAAKIAKREVDGDNVADTILDMYEVETFWEGAQDETREED